MSALAARIRGAVARVNELAVHAYNRHEQAKHGLQAMELGAPEEAAASAAVELSGVALHRLQRARRRLLALVPAPQRVPPEAAEHVILLLGAVAAYEDAVAACANGMPAWAQTRMTHADGFERLLPGYAPPATIPNPIAVAERPDATR